MENPAVIVAAVVGAAILLGTVVIKQGCVGVTVLFGKYFRILRPGLNFRIPLVETVHSRISLQLRSIELEFQAITRDQANVNFKALILYSVKDELEETIKNAAFRFIDQKSFMQALIRSVEGSVRSFVASRDQAETLGLRHEIVSAVKSHIDEDLVQWGFHLINLQINDISFDEAIMRSMAQVVASNNMKTAAQNEAQAQYITKTRVAEAEAQAKRVIAEADRDADRLRGEGNAQLRKNIADGLANAGKVMESNGVDPAFMLYTMWLDTMKHVSSHGQGHLISFDGSMEGFEKTLRQMTLLRGPGTPGAKSAH